MKKLMCLALLVSVTYMAQAQVKFGVKAGLSTQKFDPAASILEGENLSVALQNANYGYHAGIFTQIKMGKFFIQPEAVFNSSKVSYSIKDVANPDGEVLSESYQHLDIPVMMGLKSRLAALRGLFKPYLGENYQVVQYIYQSSMEKRYL